MISSRSEVIWFSGYHFPDELLTRFWFWPIPNLYNLVFNHDINDDRYYPTVWSHDIMPYLLSLSHLLNHQTPHISLFLSRSTNHLRSPTQSTPGLSLRSQTGPYSRPCVPRFPAESSLSVTHEETVQDLACTNSLTSHHRDLHLSIFLCYVMAWQCCGSTLYRVLCIPL